MIPLFKICELNNNILLITGLNQESNIYIPEDEGILDCSNFLELNKFKYSETNSMIITYFKSRDGIKEIKKLYFLHDNLEEVMTIELTKDGNYITYYLILPSLDWLKKLLLDKNNTLNLYKTIYILLDSIIYKYINEELVEVPIEEIIQRNTEDTTISINSKISFSIFYLNKCYISLCKIIFNKVLDSCNSLDDPNLIFKRDYLWMTINVIKYLLEDNLYMEALNILELINRCGYFCPKYNNISNVRSGCGCK